MEICEYKYMMHVLMPSRYEMQHVFSFRGFVTLSYYTILYNTILSSLFISITSYECVDKNSL